MRGREEKIDEEDSALELEEQVGRLSGDLDLDSERRVRDDAVQPGGPGVPCLQGLPGDLRIGAVDAGELLSILLGPSCAGVGTVALDPIPGIPEEVSARLLGVGAGRFALRLARGRNGESA